MLFSVVFLFLIAEQTLAIDVINLSYESKHNYSPKIQKQDDITRMYNNVAGKQVDENFSSASTAYYDQETGEYIEIHRTGPDSYSGYNHDKGIYLDFEINPEGSMIIYDSSSDTYKSIGLD